jgi:serine/threonine-protein kinase ULK/ATG1
LLEILEGVNYLRKQRPEITHRNLKPQNILFKQEFNSIFVKTADITAFPNFDERLEMDDKEMVYIAPEVLDFEKYDTRADVYSLGVIVRQLFLIDLNKY